MYRLVRITGIVLFAGIAIVGWKRFYSTTELRHTDTLVERARPDKGALAPSVRIVVPAHDEMPTIPFAPPSVAPTPSDTPDTAEEPRTDAERQEYAEFVFNQEVRDPSWARSAREGIMSKLADLPLDGVHIESVECRSSLCRVELASDQAESARQAVSRFAAGVVWQGPGMAVKEIKPSGQTIARVYLAKPGGQVPELE